MKIEFLQDVLDKFPTKKIMVIGDVMVDHYLWGNVERISPEAPVPVLDVKKEEYRLGGAANVALNIKSLGAHPYLIGVTGNDRYHAIVCSLLEDAGIDKDNLLQHQERSTTVKSRIIAQGQHIIRIDNETRTDIDEKISNLFFNRFYALLDDTDCIILEDYNKGLLTPHIIKTVISEANRREIPVTVDPKFKNFFEYKNCTLFKPNVIELQKNSGIPIDSEANMDAASHKILAALQTDYLVVTRGEKGLSIYRKDKDRTDIPTFAYEIFDVSGAGDTVISTMSLCLCAGLKVDDAALIANHAAGSVCSKVGIQPVYPEDIINSFKRFRDC